MVTQNKLFRLRHEKNWYWCAARISVYYYYYYPTPLYI